MIGYINYAFITSTGNTALKFWNERRGRIVKTFKCLSLLECRKIAGQYLYGYDPQVRIQSLPARTNYMNIHCDSIYMHNHTQSF